MELNLSWNLAVIALTLSIFTLLRVAHKPTIHISDKLLSIWLLVLSTPLVSSMVDLLAGGTTSPFFPWLNPALSLLNGPILFVYVQQLVKPNRFTLTHCLHLLPFAVYYLLFVLIEPSSPVLPAPNSDQLIMTPNIAVGEPNFSQTLFTYFGEFNLGTFLGYSVATLYLLSRHQQKILGYFSQRDANVSLSWVYAIPILFGFLVLLNLVNELINISLFEPTQAHHLSYLLFISVLCFFGVDQQPLYPSKTHQVAEHTEDTAPISDDKSSQFDLAELERIQAVMEKEKLFLDPDFTVYQLAESLAIPRRRLSLLLNSGFQKNFFQYVNEFRVNEVKRLLRQNPGNHLTLLDIALESGFKSKSAFNSVFKQCTGLTPSQYRKQNS